MKFADKGKAKREKEVFFFAAAAALPGGRKEKASGKRLMKGRGGG